MENYFNINKISCYPNIGFFTSVLWRGDSINWFLNTWINTYYESKKEELRLHAPDHGCSFLFQLKKIPMYLLTNNLNDGISNYIVENLSKDTYIHLQMNDYHIKGTNNYKKKYFLHSKFISGYDEVKKEFKVNDHFGGIFKQKNVSFSEIDNSFNSIKQNDKENKKIIIYKYVKPIDYKVDKHIIKKNIKLYLDSKEEYTQRENLNKNIFGVEAVQQKIKNDISKKKICGDVRFFHLMMERIYLMKLRIQELDLDAEDLSYYLQLFTKLELEYEILRNTLVKYKLLDSYQGVVDLYSKSKKLLETENNALYKIIKLI